MMANTTVCKKQTFTFILSKFIEALLVTFVFFVDTISIAVISSSHSVTEVLFK